MGAGKDGWKDAGDGLKVICISGINKPSSKLTSREPKPKLVVVNKSKTTPKRTFDTTSPRKLASREPKPKLVVVNKSKTTTERTFDTTTLGVQPKTAKAVNTKSRPEADKRPDEDKCKYTCQESGGCSVRILPKSGFVSGKSMGSCFSKKFGGSCLGTPKGCEKCLGVCADRDPGEYTLSASGSLI